jgi:hypothetical protein
MLGRNEIGNGIEWIVELNLISNWDGVWIERRVDAGYSS